MTDENARTSDSGQAVRIRGIYATALTELVTDAGYDVVQASPPIRERFEATFPDAPADVAIETTADRQGIGITGQPDAVASVAELVGDLERDTFTWTDRTPRSSVFDGVVDRTTGGGAIVDLGEGGEGYLPFDAVDAYVDDGDVLRVQVTNPTPPWDRDRPELDGTLHVPGGIVTLVADESRLVVDAPAEELARTTEILSTDVPEGWGVRWERRAIDVGFDELDAALNRAVERATVLDEELEDVSTSDETAPRALATPEVTTWCWFGRESRFALDEVRRRVTTTMVGHHRIKAADEQASAAVDFVESIAAGKSDGERGSDVRDGAGEEDGEVFPVRAVLDHFGPAVGDRVAIRHGKPDGSALVLGRGTVVERSDDGTIAVRRELTGGGTYDALDVDIEDGDVALTTFVEGRWWYPTVYRDASGERKGTYVNVGTPIELFPGAVRYVDLYVDVVSHADRTVERVDDDELDDAVAAGLVPSALAKTARRVAASIERAF